MLVRGLFRASGRPACSAKTNVSSHWTRAKFDPQVRAPGPQLSKNRVCRVAPTPCGPRAADLTFRCELAADCHSHPVRKHQPLVLLNCSTRRDPEAPKRREAL